MILAAAAVCGNPAAGAETRQRVFELLAHDRFGLIRLHPERMRSQSGDEELLMQQCLPGRRRDESRPRLPAVIVADRSLGARPALWIALAAVSRGAVAMQLDPGSRIPDWFGPATVLVCSEQTGQAVRRGLAPGRTAKSVVVGGVGSYHDTSDILHRANVLLAAELQLSVPATT